MTAAVLWAAVLFFAAGIASAETSDYDVDSTRWNGLTNFVEVGRAVGVRLKPTDGLDFDELTAKETLVLVYPRQELEVDELAEFVVEGGRILLADDYGASASFLKRLDIRRRTGLEAGLPHDRFLRDRRDLPIIEPTGVHPLLEGVRTVVANHPAVLEHRGGPVVPFSGGGGLVYDMNLGRGKVIVFGDASLLINQMMKVADNRRLAQNALGYLCEGIAECRPRLLVGSFEQTGAFNGGDESDHPLNWFGDRFNEVVERVQEEIPSDPLLYYLSLILAGGLALYLSTVFSVRESRRYSEYIEEALSEVPAPQSEFEWNVSRFGADRRETNFALPLSILKEIFEELFLQELGYWERGPGERPSVMELAREFRRQCLSGRPADEQDRIEREVRELLATYAQIPTRHRVFLDSDAYFSDRDLIKLYRRTMRTLDLMGLKEEYERRTRTLV